MDLSKFPVGTKAKLSDGREWKLFERMAEAVIWQNNPGNLVSTTYQGVAYSGGLSVVAILPCEAAMTIGSEWRDSDGKKWIVRAILSERYFFRVIAERAGCRMCDCVNFEGAISCGPRLVELWTDPPPPRTWDVVILENPDGTCVPALAGNTGHKVLARTTITEGS